MRSNSTLQQELKNALAVHEEADHRWVDKSSHPLSSSTFCLVEVPINNWMTICLMLLERDKNIVNSQKFKCLLDPENNSIAKEQQIWVIEFKQELHKAMESGSASSTAKNEKQWNIIFVLNWGKTKRLGNSQCHPQCGKMNVLLKGY